MHTGHVCGHIGEFAFKYFPVAAVGVPTVVVAGLPSVVDDNVFHSQTRGQPALGFDIGSRHFLMELIPARIQRIERGFRYRSGFYAAAVHYPVGGVGYGVAVEAVAGVKHYFDMVSA